MRVVAMLLGVLMLAGTGLAAEPAVTPVRELEGLNPKENAFRPAQRLRPIVLKSAERAARYLPEEDLERLEKEVDFERQVVLLFAWQGSGQDELKYEVAESQPEQVAFTREPGRTRDLRSHVHAYVLSGKVKWTMDGAVPEPDFDEVSWEEMQEILKTRDVESVMQTHQRRVTVYLKDGTRYATTEPGLDDVIEFIQKLGKDIPIATE